MTNCRNVLSTHGRRATSWILLLVFLAIASPVHAFPNGAGTCLAASASITGMLNRARNEVGIGPYSIAADMMSTSYIPGAEHFISITSSDQSTFAGLLLYGETSIGERVGIFDKSDAFVGSPATNCPGSLAATASHTTLGPVSETTLMIPWTAPATDVGPITFRSIVLGGRRGSSATQAFFFPPLLTLTAASVSSFDINQGITGAWFDSSTPGQGFLIDIEPASQFIFIAWFTYESTPGKVGAEDQRWLTTQGNYSGGSADMAIFRSSGGGFDSAQMVTTEQAGTMTINFDDCSNGTIDYDLTDAGLDGQIAIARLVPATSALCESLVDP